MADYLTTDTELTSVANAIRTKGSTSASLVYPTGFVSAIEAISSGTDVSDTTATAGDVRTGKYFYTSAGVKTQGTIADQAAQTIHPSTADQTIASGKYLTGTQTIKGDANLVAGNIKNGTTIFGVTGTYSGGGGGGASCQKYAYYTVNGDGEFEYSSGDIFTDSDLESAIFVGEGITINQNYYVMSRADINVTDAFLFEMLDPSYSIYSQLYIEDGKILLLDADSFQTGAYLHVILP